MAKDIPTKEVKLPQSGGVAKIYEWLTQSEEDMYLEKLVEGSTQEGVNEDGNPKTVMLPTSVIRATSYKMHCLLAEPSWEEFEVLSPTDRKAIERATQEDDKKKE